MSTQRFLSRRCCVNQDDSTAIPIWSILQIEYYKRAVRVVNENAAISRIRVYNPFTVKSILHDLSERSKAEYS